MNNEIERLEELLSIYFNIPVKYLKDNVKVINKEKRSQNKNDKNKQLIY